MDRAEASFRAGNLAASLQELQIDIRQHSADPKRRIFLAQLLMLLGQWDRAITQLNVIGELDSAALPMARAYRSAIECEQIRRKVFAGERSPLLFGEPEPWIAQLLSALSLEGQGKFADAQQLRTLALEAAPATGGTLNGKAFEWIGDSDTRLGPIFEVLLNGAYYWVPVHRVRSIAIEAPADARDLVWLPARFMWTNEGEAMGFIPTRYPGSEAIDDDAIRMSRRTEWKEIAAGAYQGLGQRLYSTDEDECGVLEVREILLKQPA
jgi:type VI secretion system protein ImpE